MGSAGELDPGAHLPVLPDPGLRRRHPSPQDQQLRTGPPDHLPAGGRRLVRRAQRRGRRVGPRRRLLVGVAALAIVSVALGPGGFLYAYRTMVATTEDAARILAKKSFRKSETRAERPPGLQHGRGSLQSPSGAAGATRRSPTRRSTRWRRYPRIGSTWQTAGILPASWVDGGGGEQARQAAGRPGGRGGEVSIPTVRPPGSGSGRRLPSLADRRATGAARSPVLGRGAVPRPGCRKTGCRARCHRSWSGSATRHSIGRGR